MFASTKFQSSWTCQTILVELKKSVQKSEEKCQYVDRLADIYGQVFAYGQTVTLLWQSTKPFNVEMMTCLESFLDWRIESNNFPGLYFPFLTNHSLTYDTQQIIWHHLPYGKEILILSSTIPGDRYISKYTSWKWEIIRAKTI